MSLVAQNSCSNRSDLRLMLFRRIVWVKMIAQVQMLARRRPIITILTTMLIDRRTMLAGSAALAAAPALAKSQAAKSGWYDRAIIIDALGGVGDPYSPEEQLRLSDRAWNEMVETGVTLLRDTVMPVGNVADPWGDYQKDLAAKLDILNANPERLSLVRTAADILKAKREKKFAWVLGTQDTSMVGGELDRLAEMKKSGVMTVQLTYNNRNLSGDGALEPANAGLSKLGKATIERIEAEKLLLDLSHGGARTMAEATAQAKRPLVISHTGARALTDHPRNTEDATIKAVADKGGVVGVYFMAWTCAFSAAPLPTTAFLTRRAAYSPTSSPARAATISTTPRAWPSLRVDWGFLLTNTSSTAAASGW